MALHHEDLASWRAAIELVVATYRETKSFPRSEIFGLTGQMRRAAAAVPANIAEGAGRGMRRDYVRFLRLARGSLAELETHIVIASRLGLLTPEAAVRL
jgi:four helix bundle protein